MRIYVDGSSRGNPGPGGFGVVVLTDDERIITTYSKQENNTTNNRQELKAILYALLNYGTRRGPFPLVYTDSAYCYNTLTNWMFTWAKKGWIKADKKIPENLDLIQAYYDCWQKGWRIDLRQVRGHAGVKWNEMADALATGKRRKIDASEL